MTTKRLWGRRSGEGFGVDIGSVAHPTLWTRCVWPTLTLLLLTGCAMRQLRKPAAEHHAQLQVLTDYCEREGLGDGICSIESLKLQVEKACLISAIAEGQDGKECTDARD